MFNFKLPKSAFLSNSIYRLRSRLSATTRSGIPAACILTCILPLAAISQQTGSKESPVIIQPGAPGQPSRILPSTATAELPPLSPKDVEFMQGMIVHHQQAVVMTALIGSRSETKELRLLGERISQSQSNEINFMKGWLEMRSLPVMASMPEMKDKENMKMSGHDHHMMPGMLTSRQMEALGKAEGAEFDRLFLSGMIQHHIGALIMVKDLFNTTGAGQDAEIFNFATDVDSGQRAEIRIMQSMLDRKDSEEK